jgi:hypothetical protein
MKVSRIRNLLEPFALVCDPTSLMPEHRLLLIEKDRIAARTGKAMLDSQFAFGLNKPFGIEAGPLLSIAASLPQDAELEFELQEASLIWSCGRSRGRLATKPPFDVKRIPDMPKDDVDCSHALSTLFQLGGLSCSNQALTTVGLYGMVLVPDKNYLWCLSSDSVTIAAARMSRPKTIPTNDLMTVHPTDINLLVQLAARPKSFMAFTPSAIHFVDDVYDGVVNLVEPLKHKLYDLATTFMSDKSAHDIDKERVQAFVKRATYLAESRQNAIVTVKAQDDALTLEFNEQLAQTEEQYPITEGFKVTEPVAVTVDAIKLAKALSNCDQLLLDNMPNHVIVFRAKSGSFHYIISGKR